MKKLGFSLEEDIQSRLSDINALLKNEYGYSVKKGFCDVFEYMIEQQLINLSNNIKFMIERPGLAELHMCIDVEDFLSNRVFDIVRSLIKESTPYMALKFDYIFRVLSTNIEICRVYSAYGCASCPLAKIGEPTGLSTCRNTLRYKTHEYAKVIEIFNDSGIFTNGGGRHMNEYDLAQLCEGVVKYAKEG